MAWEEAVYIVNKIKGTIVPMLNSLQTNVINGVNDTMNNAINNVLVPKLPDNRDPLTFSTVQMRTTKRLFAVPAYNPNNVIFTRTSGPYTTPVTGHYVYHVSNQKPSQLGEIINGKGKIVVTSSLMVFAQIDGGPVASINAYEEHWASIGQWRYNVSFAELTFSKSVRVYTLGRNSSTGSSGWNEANSYESTTSFSASSDDFNFTNSSADQKNQYMLQAYNRCADKIRAGDTLLGKNYLLYLA